MAAGGRRFAGGVRVFPVPVVEEEVEEVVDDEAGEEDEGDPELEANDVEAEEEEGEADEEAEEPDEEEVEEEEAEEEQDEEEEASDEEEAAEEEAAVESEEEPVFVAPVTKAAKKPAPLRTPSRVRANFEEGAKKVQAEVEVLGAESSKPAIARKPIAKPKPPVAKNAVEPPVAKTASVVKVPQRKIQINGDTSVTQTPLAPSSGAKPSPPGIRKGSLPKGTAPAGKQPVKPVAATAATRKPAPVKPAAAKPLKPKGSSLAQKRAAAAARECVRVSTMIQILEEDIATEMNDLRRERAEIVRLKAVRLFRCLRLAFFKKKKITK